MSILNNSLLLKKAAAASAPAEDPVTRSLRFNGSVSSSEAGHLYRTAGTPTDEGKWTMSMWVKVGQQPTNGYMTLFGAGSSNDNAAYVAIYNGYLFADQATSSNHRTIKCQDQLFRDPAAWYHLCFAYDNTQSGSVENNQNAYKWYVNGVRLTGFPSVGSGNESVSGYTNRFNSNGYVQRIGKAAHRSYNSTYKYHWDGLIADVYFVDGQQLEPTEFIEANDYGNYIPKAYTGSFGANGFHIDAQPAHDADLLVTSVGRNGGDTDFADVAQGHGLTVSGDTEHSIAVGNPFTGDDRAIYFDASGDYVTVDDSDDLTLSTDDWTIEGWFKWDGATNQSWTLAQKSWAGSSYGTGSDWHILYYSGYLRFYGSYYAYDGNNRYFHRSFTPTLGKWHHVAVVQNSGSTQLYVDGEELGTAQNTSGWSWNNSTGDLTLNRWQGAANSTYSRPDRAVYDFRIVKGTAVYTGEFTPPSGKLTATGGEYPDATNVNTSITSSHTVLHLQPVKTDSSLHDETSNHTVSKTSGTSYDKASTPFDAAAKSTAIHFDGSGDYIKVWDGSSGDYDFGTADYTIEFWVNISASSSSNYNTIFSNSNTGLHLFERGGEFYYYTSTDGGSNPATGLTGYTTDTWYHVAAVRDGTNTRVYINGKCSLNYTWDGTTDASTSNFRIAGGDHHYLDGYIYDFRVTGGEAKYSGTSTASDWANFDEITAPFELNPVYLGGDQSGNKNHFQPTNISGHDVMLDTPTKNYATLNPLERTGTTNSVSEGNLKTTSLASGHGYISSTMGLSSGKWIWAVRMNVQGGGIPSVGFHKTYGKNFTSGSATSLGYGSTDSWGVLYTQSGYQTALYNGSSNVTNLDIGNFTNGDRMVVAVDIDAGKAWWGKFDGTTLTWHNSGNPANGTNATTTFTAGTAMTPAVSCYNGYGSVTCNFGQDATYAGEESPSTTYADSDGNGSFDFQPPTGFKSLNTSNLDAPTVAPSEHFDVLTYNGAYDNYMNYSGTSPQTVTGTDFAPEIVWIKDRDNVSYDYGNGYHGGYWFDNVMGTGYALNTDLDNSSHSGSSLASGEDGISSFNSNGFSVDEAEETNYMADTDYSNTPDTAERYVAWCWKLGTTASSWGGSGQDPDTEKYNASAGVSIVNYYDSGGSGSAITLNHSLGDAPEFAIAFDYEGYTSEHYVWHKDLSSGNYLTLDSDSAQTSDTDYFPASPATATTMTLGTSISSGVTSHVALFTGVEGHSKFGTYTGNGSTSGAGPMVYLGFEPALLMIKRIDSSNNWVILDGKRNPSNTVNLTLQADSSSSEGGSSDTYLDFISTGFKVRNTSTANWLNASSGSYVFAAWAEVPFSKSNAR